MEFLIFMLLASLFGDWYEYKAFKRYLYIGPNQSLSIDELDDVLCKLSEKNQMLNYTSGTLRRDFEENGYFVFLYAGKKFVRKIANYLDVVGHIKVEIMTEENLYEKLSHTYVKDEHETDSQFFKAVMEESSLNMSIRFFGLDKDDISIKKLNVAMNSKLVKLRENNSDTSQEISDKKRRFYEKQIYEHHKLVFEWLKTNNNEVEINENHSAVI